MDTESQAPESQNSTTEAVESVEVDLTGLDLTPQEVGLDAEPTQAEAPQETAAPEAAPSADAEPSPRQLQAQLLEMQRAYDDLRQQTEPLTRQQQQQQYELPNRRYAELHEKLVAGAMNGREFAEYLQLSQERQAAQLQAVAWRDATAAASEQHARGLMNATEMGAGRDFDSLVSKHIRPLYQKAPRLQVLRELVPDQPAFADYLWATMAEVLEASKWDVPTACKKVLGALSAPGTAARQIQQVARRAEASGARQLHGSETTVSAGGKRKIENFWDMPDKDFDAIRRRNELGMEG